MTRTSTWKLVFNQYYFIYIKLIIFASNKIESLLIGHYFWTLLCNSEAEDGEAAATGEEADNEESGFEDEVSFSVDGVDEQSPVLGDEEYYGGNFHTITEILYIVSFEVF